MALRLRLPYHRPSCNPPSPILPRVLGPWIATAIVVGTVIGSGVFKKAASVAENVPEFGLAMAVWVLGGVLALLGALALAEVAVLFPRAGGNYVFLREGYGRLAGFLWGWVEFWIIRSASIAALATMFTESLPRRPAARRCTPASGRRARVLAAAAPHRRACIAALAAVNIRGTRSAAGCSSFITLVKVGVAAVHHRAAVRRCTPAVDRRRAPADGREPLPGVAGRLVGVNWARFGAALVGVLWAYHGWMNIAPVAEEVKRPAAEHPARAARRRAHPHRAVPAARTSPTTSSSRATEMARAEGHATRRRPSSACACSARSAAADGVARS